jgi:glycosyltransferase involved in cell wall biosynthesis/GT2 family glycosyltransferase
MNFNNKVYKVTVLDMQPIDPPLGGGRLRLLGLYHGLGADMPTTYVGTYDWPGEKFRRHRLSDTLEEIDIPLSKEHFEEAEKWRARAGGRTIIDASFHQLAHLSPQFIEYAKKEASGADIVVFSHPWVYPLVKDILRQDDQLIVYDSHNMEGLLRAHLLDDGSFGSEIVKEAVRAEYELCLASDIILACSHEDREMFNHIYQMPFGKIRTVPNGVFTKHASPADREGREKAKRGLGLEGKLMAVFIGSAYPPNIEAANFICEELAPELPHITFAICGGVGDALKKEWGGVTNIHITGLLEEKRKLQYLAASDIAINPMFAGSGTNIKMFDFMAAGLPVLTSPVGARGIDDSTGTAFKVCPKCDFVREINNLTKNPGLQRELSRSARILTDEKYSWERISANLGLLLKRRRDKMDRNKPFFSVIVPSFERHGHLSKLMDFLLAQRLRDFEVIIVDQSREKWPDRDRDFGIDLLYIHTDTRGSAKSRNLAAFYASGEVLAFTDDDCEPRPDWLRNARTYFSHKSIAGVEGLIKSDKYGDADYRTVTNEGFEGIGFMTANLLIRLEVFNAVNGFDEQFDKPFREDTDLGWRALSYGDIPFGHNVEVFHPPHPRSIERESSDIRDALFEKDALLLKKHPERYKTLFLMEGHWRKREGFWENFLTGAQKYGVGIPEFYHEYMPKRFMKSLKK